jgi:hypothetical protein
MSFSTNFHQSKQWKNGGIFLSHTTFYRLQVQNALPRTTVSPSWTIPASYKFQGPLCQSAWPSNVYFLAPQSPP